MANVKHFGAAGDGRRDDSDAIEHALAEGDGQLEFPPGIYRLSRTVEVDLARHGYLGIQGRQATARLVMAGPGPALRLLGSHRGTAEPSSVEPGVWDRERLPQVSGIEIVGDHPEADGIELVATMQTTIGGVLLRKLRYGIRLRERNRNFVLHASHVYDNSGVGVYFDDCNLHQAILSANHISYNRQAGILARGGDLHNLQIAGNDIEYNYDAAASGAADLWFDALDGIASEISITGNTIQSVVSPGGANVRITGRAATAPASARLISITGNILGSQEANLVLSHADRVVITGNTLYDGQQVTLRAEGCHQLVIGPHTHGWQAGADRDMIGGFHLRRCTAANLSGLLLEGCRLGDETSGGAMTLIDCTDCAVANCQILDPHWRGMWLEGCRRTRVSDNSIIDRRTPPMMLAAIEASGGSGNLIQHNLVTAAKGAAIRCDESVGTVVGNVVC